MPKSPRVVQGKRGMGQFRDAAGRLWRFWKGRWRMVKQRRKPNA